MSSQTVLPPADIGCLYIQIWKYFMDYFSTRKVPS